MIKIIKQWFCLHSWHVKRPAEHAGGSIVLKCSYCDKEKTI